MPYFAGDFDTTETVDIPFNTFSSDDPSASVTITNLVAVDLHIHKDGGTTQRSSSAGVTISVDMDSIIGNHMAHIDLSDNTDAGFYADGSRYAVRIEGTTVDSATVNAWIGGWTVGCMLRPTTAGRTLDVNATGEAGADVIMVSGDSTAADNLEAQYDTTGVSGDTFPSSQGQVNNLSTGSAAISTVPKSSPDGFVITTGSSEANTEDSTHALDGATHDLEDTAGTTDCYYIFDVGGNGVPVEVLWWGYVNSNGDSYAVQAYNWLGTTWDQVGSLDGTVGSTVIPETFQLTTGHVGTGANIGLVHLRFYSTDGTKLATDRIICSYATVAESVGYSQGAIWVDSAGTAGTEVYVNGTADNPCPWANALTINSTLGLNRFHIANDNTVTLSAACEDKTLFGEHWYLAMGSQSVNDSAFVGAHVTGIGSAADHANFEKCHIGEVTMPPCNMHDCGIGKDDGLFTAASDGEYVFHMCYSLVAGSGSPDFTFAGLGSATGINNRGFFGGSNYTLDTDCTLSHEVIGGGGTAVTPADGDVEIRGLCRAITIELSDTDIGNSIQVIANTGPVTINASGASDSATINLYGTAGSVTDGSNGTTNNEMITTASINAQVDTALSDYDGPTDTEMTAAFTEIKGATWASGTDTLEAIRDRGDAAWTTGAAGSGLTALGSGTAQSGTASTIVLAAAAAFADDVLNGNVIKIHTGTGAGQARLIVSNTLTDDTCNITPNWAVNPGADSEYEIVEGSGNVVAMLLDAQSVTDLKDFADAGYDPATNKVQGVVLTDTVTTAGALGAQAKLDVNAEADTALSDYDAPTKTEMDSAFTEIKGATWASGTDTLEHIRNKQTDIEADTNELQSDDVPTLIAALPTAVENRTEMDSNSTQLAAIVADTNELQSDDVPTLIADVPTVAEFNARTLPSADYVVVGDTIAAVTTCTNNSDMRGTDSAALATALATAQTDLDTLTGTDGATLATAQANYAPATAAEVNAQVADVLKVDVIADLSNGIPPGTPTFEEAIMYLYSALRNRTDVDPSGSPDYLEYYNDAGALIWRKEIADDTVTYSEAQGVAGS